MNTELFTLPDDFCSGSNDTLIYFYSNTRSSVKNRVVFTKNMFCLLQHGVKEVQTAAGKEVITSGQVLMLTSGSTLMSESVAENNRYEAIIIFFGNKTLTDFCARHKLTVKSSAGKAIYKVSRDAFLDNYCYSVQLLRAQHAAGMDELKTHEILAYVYSKYPETFRQFVSQALASGTDIKLKQVVELNSNKGLTIEELA